MDFSEDLSIIKFGISPLPLLPLPPPLLVRIRDSRGTLSAFAHGGSPQDRNASPTKVLNPKEI